MKGTQKEITDVNGIKLTKTVTTDVTADTVQTTLTASLKRNAGHTVMYQAVVVTTNGETKVAYERSQRCGTKKVFWRDLLAWVRVSWLVKEEIKKVLFDANNA